MALKVKKVVSFPKSSDWLLGYIKNHGLKVEDVAENLVDDTHPDGFHANWLRVMIHRGMSKSDQDAVKKVVDTLSKEQKHLKG